MAVLVGGLILNVFTSLLLGKIHSEFPHVVTLGDALQQLVGSAAGYFGYASLYVYLFVCMGNYLIVLSAGLRDAFWEFPMCRPWVTALACVVLLPTNQVRTF